MDKVIQTFERLIRRNIAPSVTFFVIFVVGELITEEALGRSAGSAFTDAAKRIGDALQGWEGLAGTIAVLLVLGVGYGLSAVQQVLFDNRLRKNFDPWPKRLRSASVQSETAVLRELRDAVIHRLRSEPRLERLGSVSERTDYLLYEILGGIDTTPTVSFVDSAKALGVVFSSVIVVVSWILVVQWQELGWWSLLFLAAAACTWWIGREATATQYRARALRLYVNFLMMPEEHLERRLLEPDEASQ